MDFNQYPITLGLIAANIILSFIAFNNRDFLSQSLMWPYGVKRQRQYYRFITSGFIHADFLHLFFNMFTLFFFGRNLEIYFKMYHLGGTASYLALYFLGLIISDLPTYVKQKDNSKYHSLGASGAVSAIVFATILFSPWSSIYIYGSIRVSAALYAVLYIVYCIYMSKQNADNINHDAHLWGSVFGLLFTVALVAYINPNLFSALIEELKNPNLLGR